MSEQFPVYRSQTDTSYRYVDLTPVPLQYEEKIDPSLTGWISAVGDAVVMQPLFQSLFENLQIYEDYDENYDPLAEENLAGYEAYAEDFIGVRSRQEQDFIKRRITNNLQRRANINRELGFGGILLSEVFNPVNYIPIPGIMGAQFGLKSVAKATTALSGTLIAEEAVRQRTDPTATIQESIDNVVYGTLFGSVLLGGLGAASNLKKSDVDRFTQEYVDWADIKKVDPTTKPVDVGSVIITNTGFEAKPTGRAQTGVESTFLRVEKITGLTFIGRMLNSGIRSVEDFTAGVVGDYGLKIARNKQGLATEESAMLAADRWRGMAADATRSLRSLYSEYRTGGPGKTVANINIFTDLQRAAEGMGFRGGAGKLMTYEEFQDAIFRAHKSDKIETDDPFVRRGVDTVRQYFDEAEKAGLLSGAIKGPVGRKKFIERKVMRSSQVIAKLEELNRLERNFTPKEQVKYIELNRQAAELADDLLDVIKKDVSDDIDLEEVLVKVDDKELKKREELLGIKADMIKKAKNQKEFLAIIAKDIEETINARIKRFQDIQQKLLKESEERGLTKKQQDYLTILTEIVDGSFPIKPTKKQQAVIDSSKKDPVKFLSDKQKNFINIIDKKLAGIYDDLKASPKNEMFYLPRFWLVDEVLADVALGADSKLRKILTKWYKENPLDNKNMDDVSVAKRVEKSIDRIVGLAELGEMQLKVPRGKSANFLRSRDLDIPNELVADFIETDLEKLMRTYGDRFGMIQEYSVKFGDTTMRDAMNDVILAAIEDIDITDVDKGLKVIDGIGKNLEQVTDIGTGNIYSHDPKMLNRRKINGWLRGFGTITSLGGAGLSSLTEIPRSMMVHGFARVFGAIMTKTFGNPELYKDVSRKLMSVSVQGAEVFNASAINRYAQYGGPTGGSTSRVGQAAQKMTDFANGPFQIMSGLAPFTDWAKGFSQFMTHNFFLEDIQKIASGKGNQKMITDFASYGLNIEDIKKIANEMPIQKEGDIYLANMGDWADEALARRYASAVNGMTRRIIPTASKQDLPLIAQGFIKGREFPLLTLPFQFMAYGFAANNKVLVSALQGRDRSAFLGMGAMIGAGYLVSSLKASLSGSSWYWDEASYTERMVRAVDQSGIAGIFSEVPTMVEAATLGEVGIRPALGLKPYSRAEDYVEALADVSGPAPSKIADLILTITDDSAGASQVGGAIRRSLPLNNLFWLKSLFVSAQKKITDSIEDSPEDIATGARSYFGVGDRDRVSIARPPAPPVDIPEFTESVPTTRTRQLNVPQSSIVEVSSTKNNSIELALPDFGSLLTNVRSFLNNIIPSRPITLPKIELERVADQVIENAPTQDKKQESIFKDFIKSLSEITTAQVLSNSFDRFKRLNPIISAMITAIPAPGRLLTASATGYDNQFTEQNFRPEVIDVLKQAARNAQAKGKNYVDYEDYPSTARGLSGQSMVGYKGRQEFKEERIQNYAAVDDTIYNQVLGYATLAWDVLTDPVTEALLSVGGFSIIKTEEGTFIRERWNFNTRNENASDVYGKIRETITSLLPVGNEDTGARLNVRID